MTEEKGPETIGLPAEADLTCQRVVALLVEYVVEDMDAETRAVFEAHLQECPECKHFLATYKETLRTIRTVRYEALPEAILTRVQQFISARITDTSPQDMA